MSQLPLHILFSEAMAAKGLSNIQVAQHLGFNNPSVVSMIRSGRMQLPEDKLQATMQHLGIPAKELLLSWSSSRKNSDLQNILSLCLPETSEHLTPDEQELIAAYRVGLQKQSVEACCSAPEVVAASVLLQSYLAGITGSNRVQK